MTAIASVCVYCGSSGRVASPYMDAAFDLGQRLGAAGIALIYGGGRAGLMGRVADGALAAGGLVTGIIPGHLHEREIGHDGVTNLIVVGSMHERKALMAERADAFVILPGGFGTLDELFEIVTWRQLGLHDKPVVLVDLDGYWTLLRELIARILAEGFASPSNASLLTVVESIDQVLPTLAAAPAHHAGAITALM